MNKPEVPEVSVQRAIELILEYIGENPERSGLKETPERVVRAYKEIFSGYNQNPADVFKVFEEPCDEMVIMRNIQFSSLCEHHMLPFTGVAHVAYIPNGKVVGASKLVRLVDIFARRLQIQERLTRQITKAIDEHLTPIGSACVISARHSCMILRGVNKSPDMLTHSLTGAFREDAKTRSELFQMIGGSL